MYAFARSRVAVAASSPRAGMGVGEVHADGRGLVEDEWLPPRQRVVDQHRDQAVRVERQVGGALVRGLGAVDVLELERRANLFERRCARSGWRCRGSSKAAHGAPCAPVGAAGILAAGVRSLLLRSAAEKPGTAWALRAPAAACSKYATRTAEIGAAVSVGQAPDFDDVRLREGHRAVLRRLCWFVLIAAAALGAGCARAATVSVQVVDRAGKAACRCGRDAGAGVGSPAGAADERRRDRAEPAPVQPAGHGGDGRHERSPSRTSIPSATTSIRSRRSRPFELKLYAGVPAAPIVFDKPGIVTLGCNIHDQMVAWVVVVDTPLHRTQREQRQGPDRRRAGRRL